MVTAGSAAASSRNVIMQIEQWQSPGVDAIHCAVSIYRKGTISEVQLDV